MIQKVVYWCLVLFLNFLFVSGVSKCFEDFDHIFDNSSQSRDPKYYAANIKEPKSFPHVVSIKSPYGHKCVGVILTRRYILSSAVCIQSPRQPATFVWLGDIPTKNASNEYKKSNLIRVEETFLHPEYDENQFFRNIGIIRLSRDIEFNSRRYPACLETDYGNSVQLALLSSYDQVQENVAITDHDSCNNYFDMRNILESEQFCAKVTKNCDFPAGSPLQRRHETIDKISTVVGLVSLRKDCKISESQVVFTRIMYFAKWIEKVIKQ